MGANPPRDATATPVRAEERFELAGGWEAVGVEPGSADERLEGLTCTPLHGAGTAAAAPLAADADPDAEDWWFRCSFPAPDLAGADEVVLRCEGIATIADVWLNGTHVLATDDMHLPYEAPVGGLLRDDNSLVVGVHALRPRLAERRPRPRWRTRVVRDQNLRWVRTSLAGRIPAFAPGPAPVGPWRPVALVARRHVAVDELTMRTSVDGARGIVRVRATLRALGGFRPATITAVVAGPTGTAEAELEVEQAGGRLVASGSVALDDVDLWWPHTHGTQPLYDAGLRATGDGASVDLACGRLGFRTVHAEDDPGLSLSVNGVPVFCRGGALLPDAIGVDQPDDVLRAMLERCRDGGMNMVRLSGVGTYGSERLYELCDELGLLVWQDFPFANLDYPIDDDGFRDAVDREARSFLARAGTHAALAVLCGNSEIEQQVGMLGLDPDLGRGPLFATLLPGLIHELEVDAHYVPSSPSGGDLPFRPGAGVAHYFGVGAYRRPLSDARRAEVRFASECLAFANVPDDEVLDSLAPNGAGRFAHHPAWKAGVPRDTGTGWDFDDVRDHYLRELFGLDPVELRYADPERYLTLSRVTSGEVIAATLGEWRRSRSTCRGALLWTLNDVLPGPGWGVLDHRGLPKAAYWYARRALAPIAVWMTDEGTNGVALHVANDRPARVSGAVEVALHRADGLVIASGSTDLDLAGHATTELSVETVLGHFADASYAFRFGPPEHDVVVARLRGEGGAVLSESVFHPHGLPSAPTPVSAIGLEATLTDGPEGPQLTVRSERLAHAVSVRAGGFAPSDDWFTVAPGGERHIALRPTGTGADDEPPAIACANGVGIVRVGRVE